jgi:GNAT superfamily N-acetyltransferase
MDDQEIIYQLYSDEDPEPILKLMSECFNRDFYSHFDWYQWFHRSCPTGDNKIFVAVDKESGRLAGGYGLLPISIKYNSDKISGLLCTNVMTHPDFRGKGIFVNIGKHALKSSINDDYPIALGIPNKNAYPGHMKAGWEVRTNLSFYHKKSFSKKDVDTTEVSKFDERINELLKRISKNVNFMVAKDHRFLNWRYADRPDKDYLMFIHERSGEIDGYVVLKHFETEDNRKTHILDIMADNFEILSELVQTAENHAAGKDELNLWMIDNGIYLNEFKELGFTKDEENSNMLILYDNDKLEDLVEKNWWICLGDNDVY